MHTKIPSWALRTLGPDDHVAFGESHRRGTLQIAWPDLKALRAWAKRQGWPTPWLGFEKAFFARMLESEPGFMEALRTSGIKIQMPLETFTLSAEAVGKLDALYEKRSAEGRPERWATLVEELREIRRAVEAGVVVEVEGSGPLRTWQGFYSWAHGRYHMLEDGADKWIGDDG